MVQPAGLDVIAAANLFHHLGDRIGAVAPDASVPHAVLRQKWSSISVPIIWAAAGDEPSCGILGWLKSSSDALCVHMDGGA